MSKSTKSIKDSIKLGGGQALTICFSVIYFIFIARRFSASEILSIGVLGNVTGLSNMIANFGLVNTCIQRVPPLVKAQEHSQISGLLRILLLVPLLAAVIIGLVFVLFAVPVSQIFFKTPEYASVVMVIAVGIAVSRLYESCSFALQVLDQFGRFTLLRTGNDILTRILALWIFFSYGIVGYLATLILGQFILCCIVIFWLYPVLRVKVHVHNLKELFSFSLPFYGYGILNFATAAGDQSLVYIFLSPASGATYYIARRFLDYLNILTDTILRPVMPKISAIHEESLEVLQNAFFRASRYLSMTIIPVSFLIAIYSHPLFEIYGKGKYIAGVPVLIVLCVSAIIYSLYYLYSLIIWIGTKPINTFNLESVRAVSSLLLSGIYLYYSSNINGFAVIQVVSNIIGTLFARYLMTRQRGFLPMDWNSWIKIFMISVLSSIPSVILQFLFHPLWIIPFYVVLSMAIYLFLFARFLQPEDLQLFSHALPSPFSQLLMKTIHYIRHESYPVSSNPS